MKKIINQTKSSFKCFTGSAQSVQSDLDC